jgi:hypothetical protein
LRGIDQLRVPEVGIDFGIGGFVVVLSVDFKGEVFVLSLKGIGVFVKVESK